MDLVEETPSAGPTSDAETAPDFVIVSVEKITAGIDDALVVNCTVLLAGSEPEPIIGHAYRDSDPHGLNPVVRQWLVDHPDFSIHPYVPPDPLTPQEIREQMPSLTARQFRLGLVARGYSPAQVTQAIDTMPDGTAKETAKIEWEYATTFNRMHPLIATVGAALGLNDTQIDAMWLAAVNL